MTRSFVRDIGKMVFRENGFLDINNTLIGEFFEGYFFF